MEALDLLLTNQPILRTPLNNVVPMKAFTMSWTNVLVFKTGTYENFPSQYLSDLPKISDNIAMVIGMQTEGALYIPLPYQFARDTVNAALQLFLSVYPSVPNQPFTLDYISAIDPRSRLNVQTLRIILNSPASNVLMSNTDAVYLPVPGFLLVTGI